MSPESPATPYLLIGGEPTVRALVKRFYQLMDELPEAWEIRKLHPQDLSGSEEKLYLYLTGWLGGPQLYVERHGHPRLRSRHLPFPVDSRARDQWMLCMRMALEENVADEGIRAKLAQSLQDLADFMRNMPDAPAA
ncbi:MAG: group II truncated hemoglobin [Rhodocyclaceae bacterium]|nr:group II truncated hemoglobin [Rhodocyclaceae bacterium]